MADMDLSNIKMLIKASTNYDVSDESDALLSFLYDTEKQKILDNCNIKELPDTLQSLVEERTAGRFIQLQKNSILGADNLEVVSSIKLGDTTVELDGSATDERLNALVNALLGERDLSCYRKLRW